jgi:HD-like signal output (HDOD) protein
MVLDDPDELPVFEAERQAIGFDHCAVGGELAQRWHLPALLAECIAHHHDIGRAVEHPREVALVHIANSLALMAELDTPEPADVTPIDARAWTIAGLAPDCIEPAMRAAQTEIAEVEELFTAH